MQTKHGNVNTDFILFIASGAFHTCKPSDLLAELQVSAMRSVGPGRRWLGGGGGARRLRDPLPRESVEGLASLGVSSRRDWCSAQRFRLFVMFYFHFCLLLFFNWTGIRFFRMLDPVGDVQGRLPIRVQLKGLTEEDMYRILTEPVNNLIRQQVELMRTENVSTLGNRGVREHGSGFQERLSRVRRGASPPPSPLSSPTALVVCGAAAMTYVQV